jgi:hypothetical protein
MSVGRLLADILADLSTLAPGEMSPARWRRRLLLWGAATAAALWVSPRPTGGEFPPRIGDSHAVASLILAANDVYCGKRSSIWPRRDASDYLLQGLRSRDEPLLAPLVRAGGSLEGYCAAVTYSATNNENALMLVERAFLWFHPRSSLQELGGFLAATRAVLLLAFSLALLGAGASPLLSVAPVPVGLTILANLEAEGFAYSNYPYLTVLVPALVAGLTLARHRAPSASTATHSGVGLALGGMVAFMGHLRTSTLPLGTALFIALVLAWARDPRRSRRWFAPLEMAGAFALGVFAFNRWIVEPAIPPRELRPDANVHHLVAHPVVLSLAIPANPLAEREGIAWDDAVGPQLARRVAPGVPYPSAAYERALWTYYLGLWRNHPREMLDVYRRKFHNAGRVRSGAAGLSIGGRWLSGLLLPFEALPGGFALLGLYLEVAAFAWRASSRGGRPLWFMLCLLSLAAALVHVEAAMIMPAFRLRFHGYLLLYACLLVLFGIQGAAEAVAAWIRAPARTLVPPPP